MLLDILIAVGLVILTATMGYLGVHVTLHAQTDPKKIRLFKTGFVFCAAAMAGLIVWQTVLATNQQRENAALLARIEKNTEHPPNVTVENKIDTTPLAQLFKPEALKAPKKDNKGSSAKAAKERTSIKNRLGVFLYQGREIRNMMADVKLTDDAAEKVANSWASLAQTYLNEKLGSSYASRFIDDTGIPAVNIPAITEKKMEIGQQVYNRCWRLEEFLRELHD